MPNGNTFGGDKRYGKPSLVDLGGLTGLIHRNPSCPEIAFRLIHELAADGMDTAVACRVLAVSRSGYYEWKGRLESARETRSKELLKW